MATVSEYVRSCGVKIEVTVCGSPAIGSGVIYATPDKYNYNYVLTAKHLFQEDSQTEYDLTKVYQAEVYYNDAGVFRRIAHLYNADLEKNFIWFDKDFAMLKIPKRKDVIVPQILLSDEIGEGEKFFLWGTTAANTEELNKIDLVKNDPIIKRFKSPHALNVETLHGISGSGVFREKSSILLGVICQYPNKGFQNNTLDCTLITIGEINDRLLQLGMVELDTEGSAKKRIVDEGVVYINQAPINGAALNLDLAVKRLKTDMEDDWFHDPLKYIDLLHTDYLFSQFGRYFGKDKFVASPAEKFYVPKKQFTLRQALISPLSDRIVYMACVSAIAESLDNAMVSTIYSARYNKYSDRHLILNGVEQWKKMQYQIGVHCSEKVEGHYRFGCIIEIDLLNFYDNIDRKLLHKKIKRVCSTGNERRAADLLAEILHAFAPTLRGLPQNSDASSLLASFYLNQVDTFMVNHCAVYLRFMDDIRIFCKDKYEARRILQLFETELRRCHLSVNSQKTKILSLVESRSAVKQDEISRYTYEKIFNLDLNKLSRYRKSNNYAFYNDAFHLCVELLTKSLEESDNNDHDEIGRQINFALNTVVVLAKSGSFLRTINSSFESAVELAVNNLKDKPWITPQVCRVLNMIPEDIFLANYFPKVKELLIGSAYNMYVFQTYQLWLLLARHKCHDFVLKQYAVAHIEANDRNRSPEIAAMIIYVCSIDQHYGRVMMRKLDEKFNTDYFQNRLTRIALRRYSPDLLADAFEHEKMKGVHEFTNKYGDKDLVFIQGQDGDADSDGDDIIEQLYSI